MYQALSLDYSLHTEQSMSFQLGKYLGVNFEEDYLSMLGDWLQRLKHVYIIIHREAMAPDHRGSVPGNSSEVIATTLRQGLPNYSQDHYDLLWLETTR